MLAKYIGEKDFRSFRDGLKNSTAAHSRFLTAESLNAGDLEAGAMVEIGYSLKHNNICEYYGFTAVRSLGNCIEMEWVDGKTLEAIDELFRQATELFE